MSEIKQVDIQSNKIQSILQLSLKVYREMFVSNDEREFMKSLKWDMLYSF